MKDIPKRPFSQCLSTIISPLFAEVRCPVDGWGPGERGRRGRRHSCLWQGALGIREVGAADASRGTVGCAPGGRLGWALPSRRASCFPRAVFCPAHRPGSCRHAAASSVHGAFSSLAQGDLNFSCAAFYRTWLGAAWPLCFCQTWVQFSSVAQSCLTLYDPMNHGTPGLPVHHQLPEPTQTHLSHSSW